MGSLHRRTLYIHKTWLAASRAGPCLPPLYRSKPHIIGAHTCKHWISHWWAWNSPLSYKDVLLIVGFQCYQKPKKDVNLGDESCYIIKIFKGSVLMGKKERKENARLHTAHLNVLSLNSWASAENSIRSLKADKWLSVSIKHGWQRDFILNAISKAR